jgi:glycosyltransferase involved in cell wall biosynthesis
MKISICALTFRRPEGLRRLLAALNSLEFAEPQPAVEIVAVDCGANDLDQG